MNKRLLPLALAALMLAGILSGCSENTSSPGGSVSTPSPFDNSSGNGTNSPDTSNTDRLKSLSGTWTTENALGSDDNAACYAQDGIYWTYNEKGEKVTAASGGELTCPILGHKLHLSANKEYVRVFRDEEEIKGIYEIDTERDDGLLILTMTDEESGVPFILEYLLSSNTLLLRDAEQSSGAPDERMYAKYTKSEQIGEEIIPGDLPGVLSGSYNVLLDANALYTVGVNSNGSAVVAGEFLGLDLSDWKDIVSVSVGIFHVVGVKSDGSVIAAGHDTEGETDVSSWTDIVAISAGGAFTLGLKSDGTVISCGWTQAGRRDVDGWTDIIAISAGGEHSLGLKKDGTVVATGNNLNNECNVGGWSDIVAISAGASSLGVKSDGTVVATGANYFGELNIAGWTDIAAVSSGASAYSRSGSNVDGNAHTVGLKKDGTVVAAGSNDDGQCDISDWRDIIFVSAGHTHTVGLKSDGTVMVTGSNEYGQSDLSGWGKLRIP